MAYSTQASIEAKVKANRIILWADKDEDGSYDTDALDSAFQEAKDTILEHVQKRYGSTIVDTWDSSTPDWIGNVSDWLSLFNLMMGSNVNHPVITSKQEEMIRKLEAVRDYDAMIPGVTFTSGQTNEAYTSDTTSSIYDEDLDCSCFDYR